MVSIGRKNMADPVDIVPVIQSTAFVTLLMSCIAFASFESFDLCFWQLNVTALGIDRSDFQKRP